MNKIYFLAILLISAFSVQAQRTVDIEVTDILSPADLRSGPTGTPIQITAVVKNNGPDSVFAGDSLAYQMVVRATNDAVIVAIPNRSLLAVTNTKDLGVGDTVHFTTIAARINANATPSFNIKLQATVVALNRNTTTGITAEVAATLPDNTFTLNTIWFDQQGWGVGVETVNQRDMVSVYPNPSVDKVRVNWLVSSLDAPSTTINVFDMTGKLVKSQESDSYLGFAEMNVEDLYQGVYMIEVRSGDFVQTSKMTVSH